MSFPTFQVRLLACSLVVLVSLGITGAARAQQAFPTADAAANALVDGIARHDGDQVRAVLGADYRRYVPLTGRSESDTTNFLAAWARAHKIVPAGADKALLEVGEHGWTLPIPIVKTAAGWRFDTRAGAEEMRIRRIGRNELAAMQVSLAYVDAQREYFELDRDGDRVRAYAMKALSSPGRHDGLYWASLPDEAESPLGAQFADARAGQPYHGYHYRILTAQGPAAPGGAKRYVRDGRMTEGFALVAWPARYNDTGVMTFIVNQDGVVYEKDLGPATTTAAQAIKAYNPDASWRKSQPDAP
jgi:hypothetical protein